MHLYRPVSQRFSTIRKQITHRFVESFSLDARALSIFRIGLALLLLIDLITNLGGLTAHFTDQGIFPVHIIADNFSQESLRSLHMISGDYWFQLSLFVIHFAFAISLLLGYQTRVSTIICRWLLCSLQARSPLILNGGDFVLRMFFFWAMFLPLERHRSIDSIGHTTQPNQRIFSIGTIWLIVQLFLIYTISGILKTDPIRTSEFTAMYYALSLDMFVEPIGQWLYSQYELMRGMTAFVYYMELYGVLLYLLPRKRTICKTATCLLFIGFHLGLILTLEIGLFPRIAIIGRIALLPAPVRDRIQRWHLLHMRDDLLSMLPLRSPGLIRPLSRRATLFGIVALWYIVSRNIRTTDFDRHSRWFPYEINRFGLLLRVDQYRNMFSPYPLKDNGRYVIEGETVQGQFVDPRYPHQPLSRDKPDQLVYTFPNDKRRKMYINLRYRDKSHYRPYLAHYLCTQRNDQATPDRQLAQLSLYYMLEVTLDHYQRRPIEKVHLGTYQCD